PVRPVRRDKGRFLRALPNDHRGVPRFAEFVSFPTRHLARRRHRMSPAPTSPSPTTPPMVDTTTVAKILHQEIGTALAQFSQAGAVDWRTLSHSAQILSMLRPAAGPDPSGACHYQLQNGDPVCAQLTQSQCAGIGGFFVENGVC